jgi:hypothetical protein
MDNVQEANYCINIPLSRHFRSHLLCWMFEKDTVRLTAGCHCLGNMSKCQILVLSMCKPSICHFRGLDGQAALKWRLCELHVPWDQSVEVLRSLLYLAAYISLVPKQRKILPPYLLFSNSTPFTSVSISMSDFLFSCTFPAGTNLEPALVYWISAMPRSSFTQGTSFPLLGSPPSS